MGAIAGGVVGGVAAIAIIGGLVWWLRRRKHEAAGKYQQHKPEPAADLREGRAEMDAYTKPVEMSGQPYDRPPAELYQDWTPSPREFSPVELDGTSAVPR